MQRILLLVMLCLLPLQISWAAVSSYCEHEHGKSAQHFGHHDDEHKTFAAESGPDMQPGNFSPVHDHCHMSVFLGLLNETGLYIYAPPARPSLQRDDAASPLLALDRPERPKWCALA